MFSAAILLLLGLVYLQTSDILSRRVDHILATESSALSRTRADIILQVVGEEAARNPLSSFALLSSSGDYRAGDKTLQNGEARRYEAPYDLPGHLHVPPRRALAARLPWGEILIVARDTSQLIEFKNVIFSALLWSGALISILGVLLATVLSLRPLHRIRATQVASQAIASGDLAVRLPINGSRDEIDELASIVNAMMDEVERLVTQARTVGESIAHELRTPMTRLRATLEHVGATFEPDDFRRAMLETCIVETDSVLARFTALLRIAAVESRTRQTAVERTSLSSILEQAVELYEPLALDKGLQFRSRILPDVFIKADAALLFEAVSNLIDNAIKFTPTGGVVQVGLSKSADGPLIKISDTGIGIDPAERSLVAKRFYRSPDVSRFPGHGLGLSLVAAVVSLHEFELLIENAQPGTTFKILCREAGAIGR
jgi:signal transduction histidine kinase